MREHDDQAVRFLLVGGFLGAGKTTALLALAERLTAAGERVALIVNDKAGALVDAAVVRLRGLPVAELIGGCFCCRLPDLIERCDEILETIRPTVLAAEPVGSSADLSGAVLQPLKRYYGARIRALPYTVLCDPERIEPMLDGELRDSPLAYLFGKQLDEADVIALSKVDRLTPERCAAMLERLARQWPATPLLAYSALSGEGLEAWWSTLCAGPSGGRRVPDMETQGLAEAEAALGWLNAEADLTAAGEFDPVDFARELLATVRAGAARATAEIGHVKLLLQTPDGSIRGHLTGLAAPLEVVGDTASAQRATLVINARVAMAHDEIEALVARALRRACNARSLTLAVQRVESFQPGRAPSTVRFATPIDPP